MLGIVLAFIATVLLTIADSGKKKMTEYQDQYFVVWVTITVGLIIMAGYLLVVGLPEIQWNQFWVNYVPHVVFMIIIEVLFIIAIKESDLSLSMPFLAFEPLFALPIAFFWLGELPTTIALIGIGIIIVGAYLINIHDIQHGLLAPFKAALKQKGPRLMIVLTVIFAIVAIWQKQGSNASSPVFFFFVNLIGMFIFFSVVLVRRNVHPIEELKKHSLLSIVTSIFWGVGLALQYAAYVYTLVVYVIVIRLLQLIFSIPIGYFFFKEEKIVQRMIAGIVMCVGVALVVLFG